ncbi:hypothetical protein PINS_up011748 [Pythium insidiosum]|nr:hypothetical protein PINS_up011748 [Pythium insidiosum]
MTAVSSRRGRLAFLFFFCALALTASLSGAQAQSTTAPPPSKCEICRDKGDCSMAFANQPGQFCGHWLDAAAQRRACCCAIQDTCVREVTTECKCQKGKQSGPAPAVKATPAPTPKKEEKSKSKIWIIIGVIVFLGLVGVLVFMYMRRKRENEEAAKEHDNYASTPHVVVESTTYVQQAPPQPQPQPVYAAPPTYAAAPAPVYSHQSPPRRRSFNGAGVAVGAAAGLVGGMLIGHALADGGDDRDGGDDEPVMTYAGDF